MAVRTPKPKNRKVIHPEPTVEKATQPKKSNVEQLGIAVRKAIYDNLRDLSEAELRVKVDPTTQKTCVEQLEEDKLLWLEGKGPPMGARYYLQLRLRFQGPDRLASVLKMPAGAGDPSTHLLEAIELALGSPPKREKLIAFARSMTEHRVADSVCLMKFLATLRASVSKSTLDLAIELFEGLQRVKAWDRLSKEKSAMQAHLDGILCEAYARCQVARVGPQKFIGCYEHLIHHILPVPSMTAVLALKQGASVMTVAEHLDILVESSMLGEKLFGPMAVGIVSSRVSDKIDEEVQKLRLVDELTETEVSKCTKQCLVSVRAIAGVQKVEHKRREVYLSYGEWKLTCEIAGLENHVEAAIRASLRHWSVRLGLLDALPGESSLVQSEAPLTFSHIDASLYSRAALARAVFDGILKGESDLNGERMQELWSSHSRRILGQDRHAWIDRLWLTESTGGAAFKELAKQILSHMPTHSEGKSLDDVIKECEKVRATDLYKSADGKAKAAVDVATNALLKMSRKGSPVVDENQGEFLQTFFTRAAFFCVHEKEAKQKGSASSEAPAQPATRLSGRVAALEKLRLLRKKKPEELTLPVLEEVSIYAWLLAATDREWLNEQSLRAYGETGKSLGKAKAEPKAKAKGKRSLCSQEPDEKAFKNAKLFLGLTA